MTPEEVISKLPPNVAQSMSDNPMNKSGIQDILELASACERVELYDSIDQIDTSEHILAIYGYLGSQFNNAISMDDKHKWYDEIGNSLSDIIEQ